MPLIHVLVWVHLYRACHTYSAPYTAIHGPSKRRHAAMCAADGHSLDTQSRLPVDAACAKRFWPRPYPTEELQSKLVDNIVIYSPIKADQCWDAPLPCTPILNNQLRPRGDSVAAGLRRVQTEAIR